MAYTQTSNHAAAVVVAQYSPHIDFNYLRDDKRNQEMIASYCSPSLLSKILWTRPLPILLYSVRLIRLPTVFRGTVVQFDVFETRRVKRFIVPGKCRRTEMQSAKLQLKPNADLVGRIGGSSVVCTALSG